MGNAEKHKGAMQVGDVSQVPLAHAEMEAAARKHEQNAVECRAASKEDSRESEVDGKAGPKTRRNVGGPQFCSRVGERTGARSPAVVQTQGPALLWVVIPSCPAYIQFLGYYTV